LLRPVFGDENARTISTGLQRIEYSEGIGESWYIIGTKENKRFLVLLEDGGVSKTWYSLDGVVPESVRIFQAQGNTFIKTKNALLLLYHRSKKLEWLINGEILAATPEMAVYST
jgi:hypothetical protein